MRAPPRRVRLRLPGPSPWSRGGFILPFVILAMLAVTSLALAAFTLARAEHRATEWERGRLAALADPMGHGIPLAVVATLGYGYQVVEAPDASVAGEGLPASFLSPLRLHRVAWCLVPNVEAGGAWWASVSPPRLGPLGMAALVDLLLREPGVVTGSEIVLPGVVEGDSVRVGIEPGGGAEGIGIEPVASYRVAALPGPGGTFLVVADGALVLAGEGALAGVLIVGSDVRIGEGVDVAGGIRAGGEILNGVGEAAEPLLPVEDLASRALRTQALEALPSCPQFLWEGGRLGYF